MLTLDTLLDVLTTSLNTDTSCTFRTFKSMTGSKSNEQAEALIWVWTNQKKRPCSTKTW